MARRKSTRRQATLRAQPTFEPLEARCMLANVHWNVDADGFWDVAANWIDDVNVARVPGASDDVFLDRIAAPVTITHRSGADSVKSLHADTSGLVLSGGSLTNTEASDLGGAFTLSGGSLIANAPLATTGDATWSGGTVRGTSSLSNTGQWTLTGSTVKSLGSVFDTGLVFENFGTIVHSGTGNLGSVAGSTLINRVGALYDFQGDGSVTDAGGGTATFSNAGTLRKSAGSGTSSMALRNFTNAGGTIDVLSGTLANATIDGVSTGGTFTVAAGAVLDLAANASYPTQYVGAYTGSGAGAVRVSNGTLQVGAAGATFNFSAGLFQWTSGTIVGGLTGLTNAGFMTIAGTELKQLFGVLRNAGTITHSGTGNVQAYVDISDPTRLNNLSGGVYDFQTDASFTSSYNDDTSFNNAGTLRKSGGTGTSSFVTVPFNNTGGVLDVRTGTLRLGATSTGHTGGTFQVAAGAVLDLKGSSTPVFAGNYSGSGPGAIRLDGGTLRIGTGGASFDFPEGAFHWTSGIIDATAAPLTNRGSMTLDTLTGSTVLRGTLQNAGRFLHLDGAILQIWGESGLGNLTNLAGGVYELQGAAVIQHAALHGPGSALHNLGTVLKSTGTGTARIDTDVFDNVGTVEVDTGELLVQRIVSQAQGTTLTGGVWKVHAGGTLEFANSPRFATNAATVVLDGPESRFPAIDSITNNTGSLTITGGRRQNMPIGRVVRSFSTGIATGGIAYDPSTGNVFVLDAGGLGIREYTADGTEVLPRLPSPGNTAIQFDLDVAPEPLTVGGTLVPAGTLLVVNGVSQNLYAIDKNDGAILASVPLTIPALGGGSYHAERNSMFLVNSFTVYEVDPATGAVLQSFSVQPTGTTPFPINTNGADVVVDPATGNLLVGTRSQAAIREFTVTGQFVRDQSLAGLGLGLDSIRGMAVNATTRRLWLCDTAGTVYEVEALFSNSGNVTLAPASTLDVPGTFNQSASGTLTTQVGGNPASGQFGRVITTGPATLDGTFGVNLVNGFGPLAGQQFSILTFPSATGSFSELTGLDGGRLPLFTVDQLPQSVVLNAVGSAADLAFSGFVAAAFPATATAGENISVTYDVANLSDTPAIGDWFDSLYFSRDGSLDESDTLLGRVEHHGGVAATSTYQETLTAPVPPLVNGNYRVLVLSDSRGLVPDGNRANNVGFSSSTIALTVPTLTLGTSVTETISNGQDRYYRLTAPPGKDVKITAAFANTDVAEVFVRYRELPDRTNFDQVTSASDLQQRLLITNAQGGSYYVLVHGREGSGVGASFTLLAEATGFEIVSVTPLRGSNQGPANVQVTGSQFTAQTMLSLHKDSGESLTAQTVQFIDANHLWATFNLVGLPTGNYRLRADDAGNTVDAFDTFTVTGEPLGLVSLSITSPAIVRVGAAIGVNINIDNGNDSQAIAPIMQIVATNVSGEKEVFVQGEGLDALPGWLLPLYNGSAGVTFQPDPKVADTESTFDLYVINPTLTPINWDGQKESLRPHGMAADTWDAIWANLRPELGDTMAAYYALLKRDQSALAQLGVKTNSIDQLYHFEMRKANDLPAVPVPASVIDLAFPAPGLPLAFARDFGESIAQRYYIGRLGRGWIDNFDVSLENDTTVDIVTIHEGYAVRLFAKNASGVYQGLPGDSASLTQTGSGFQLREKDGSLVAFLADGGLDYLQDTNNNRITAGYAGGQLTSLTHSNGSALTLAYNAAGRITHVTDPAGRVATYSYDASGENLVRVATSVGATDYTYTSETSGPRAHALATIAYPSDTHYFFAYDSHGRLAQQEQDGGAGQTTITYGVTSYRVRDALGNLTDVYFDDSGRTKATLDGLGRNVQIGHTGVFPTRFIAPDGTSSTSQFDEHGNAIQIVDPLGHEQQFSYESTFNNLTEWQDALGHTTRLSYDSSGNPQSITFPDGTVEQFQFDAQGNLVGSVNRQGQSVSYTYNADGRVTRKDLPDGTHVDFIYDTRGNLLSAAGSIGATSMEYDLADRMTKITYPDGRFLQYVYDAGGRRTQATDQSGYTVNYIYDAVGLLAQLTDGAGQPLVTYEYDATGRLSRENHGNETSTTYEFDAADQLLHLVNFAIDGVTIQSRFDYTYDLNGRRTSMTTLDGTTEYVYDAAGRLIQATLPLGRILTYAYDAAGNRTLTSDSGVNTAYTVNNMNQYLAVGGTNQGFDPDGNLVSSSGPSGPRSYSYDAEGQLISVVTAQGIWTYEYDALGNRLSSTHNGVRTQYLIDPAGTGDVFGEYDGSGNLVAHYVYGLGLVSRTDATGPAAYYQFDAQGNTAQLTGPGGVVLNSYSYVPFGEALQVSETVSNPFTFVGQLGVMREGNGLDYMRNRWYDPAQGRFTQQDPIGPGGGANLYAYVGNNPISLSDPTGFGLESSPFTVVKLGQNLFSGVRTYTVSESTYTSTGNSARAAVRASQATSRGVNLVEKLGDLAHDARQALYFSKVGELYRAAKGLQFAAGEIPAAAEVGLVAAGIAGLVIIEWEALYLSNYVATGDTPECLPLLPGMFQPYCHHPLLELSHVAQSSSVQKKPGGKDPNEIHGPGGFGAEGFLTGTPTLPYSISFENLATAGGPATEIAVTEQLDADLDLATFQLGSFGFGDLVIDVPAGRQNYYTRIDLRKQPAGALTAAQGLFVDVVAKLDRTTRVVTWKFTTLDPATLDLPINPFLGFLPPNQAPGEGQGFVNYSVRPILGSPSGTRIDAQASIVFDANDALATNVFTNTLDLGAPTSSVSPLPAVSFTNDFTVSWAGSDDAGGSGIGGFDIYVSDDSGPFTLWKNEPGDTFFDTFNGTIGHTYAFYSVATDNVGHREDDPAAADATTQVELVDTSTTTVVTSDHLAGSVYGQSVVFMVIVSSDSGTPSGNVQFEIDGVDFGAPVSLSGGTASFSTSTLTAISHTITALYTSDDSSFDNSQGEFIQIVTPAALTITADDATMTYGGPLPSLAASYSGFVNGDTAASLTSLPSVTTTATAASPVSGYAITASGAAGSNYTIAYTEGTLTVMPATLAIRADDKNKVYGSATPALSATITGFVNGESLATSGVTGQPLLELVGDGVHVGQYIITVAAGTLNASNYEFPTAEMVDGTLEVTPAALVISADSKSKIYGAVLPPLTASFDGFVNGDTPADLAAQPTLATTATVASHVGDYPITAGGAASSDYTINYVDGGLSVTSAALRITAEDKSKVYGAAIVELTALYEGLVNGDTPASLSTPPTLATTATAGGHVGSYPITVSGAIDPDYEIDFVDGLYAITPAALSITAEDKSKVYGAAIVALTAAYDGLVNGDTPSDLTTQPTLATTATAASDVASYPITASGAADPDYTITHVPGTYNVTPAPLSIKADDKTKVAGMANPPLTFTATGFVNGDTAANLTTQPTLTTTATTNSPSGSYPIAASGAVSSDYTIVYVAGTLLVTDTTAEGAITGMEYFDVTGNGLTTDDTPLPGVQVYLDTDNDGSFSGSEPMTTTLADGSYGFPGLEAGVYTVRQIVPEGYVRTAPALSDHYTVNLETGQTSSGNDFADAEMCDLSILSNVVYVINGINAVSDLRGNTNEGDTVQVSFTIVAGVEPHRFTLVSYTAPGASFDPATASQQQVFDLDTGDFGPGTYTLAVTVPHGYYQVDFVCGAAIDQFGPAGSNIFYSPQNRLHSADNGGSHAVLAEGDSLSGFVYHDANNNGTFDGSERPVPGAVVRLSGKDSKGKSVSQTVTSDVDGAYLFDNLPAGKYTITETQPAGYTDGKDTLGTRGGSVRNDKFSNISLSAGDTGENYNFGEGQVVGSAYTADQTGSAAFWSGSSGQALIKQLNGGQNAKSLSAWLVATFGNVYGSSAGSNNLTGKTNAQVAAYFQQLYSSASKQLEAELLALALSTYSTNSSLAGNVAASYGFSVSSTGLGAATVNVGASGAAFGVANDATMTVLEVLQRMNARSRKGLLWDANGNGLSTSENLLRNQAYLLFEEINAA